MEWRRGTPTSRPLDLSLFHFLSARLALCEGQPEKAEALGQLALEQAHRSLAAATRKWSVTCCSQRLPRVLGELRGCGEGSRPRRANRPSEFQLHALLPVCSLNEANRSTSRAATKTRASRPCGPGICEHATDFTWAYCVRRHLLAELCAKALQAGIETDFVAGLIRGCELSPPAGAVASSRPGLAPFTSTPWVASS